MGYDLHIVRILDWFDADSQPIKKHEVDHLIEDDPELSWSTTDYVDMGDGTGATTRYFMIEWNGDPLFWWYRDQIICSGADETLIKKLIGVAALLNANVVGDDGEHYRVKKGLLGKEKLVIVAPSN